MTVALIAAIAENNAIGLEGKLLYHLPQDMRRFRLITTGNTVLMGRNTYRSLPKGALPNRLNVVLSRTGRAQDFPGCLHFTNLPDALKHLQDLAPSDPRARQLYVIGGAQLYTQTLPLADRLLLTRVHDTPSRADAFFPAIDPDDWTETLREPHSADEKHSHPYTFIDLVRVSKAF